ncbi:NucA/NucB deoxyribonuclease domain-containing protein [Streptomyces sp. NPDC006267]|uniref:NucA/NucB deoxyribonuclease domain-containing protein n=1 Tax=Streptomyces sp. NPDC006267 TaxID=3157173 RepID=UPI0033B77383
MPGYPSTGLGCDEFPTASTYEGAARAEHEGAQYTDEFSARYIDSDENQEAGSRLGAWYDNDRILNSDAFILVIGDRPGTSSGSSQAAGPAPHTGPAVHVIRP